jgi:poly(A) polymerase
VTGLFDQDPQALAARRIASRLSEAGHQALFAGGAVRDALLGRAPKDIDIATSALPGDVESLFPRTHAVGRAFGVVVVVEGDVQFEVATFRAEAGYSDGRHPDEVTFADAEADASRRDFTVNGLFYDPVGERVLDFVGGRVDLRDGVLRAIGDPHERFGEDRLRLMRAVRFCASLGFEIEAATWTALCDQASHLEQVSAERIRDELLKMLAGPAPDEALELLLGTGLLPVFLPEAVAMVGCTQPERFHPEGDVWTHTVMMLRLMAERSAARGEPAPPELALAVLLHDIGKPPTRVVADRIRFNGHDALGARLCETILRRLRSSRELIRRVGDLVGQHMRFMVLEKMRPAKRNRWLRDPLFPLHLELHWLDCQASHGLLDHHEFATRALAELPGMTEPRLVRGTDLIALGVPEGPLVGELLERIADRTAAGEFADRAAALAGARSLVEAWRETVEE